METGGFGKASATPGTSCMRPTPGFPCDIQSECREVVERKKISCLCWQTLNSPKPECQHYALRGSINLPTDTTITLNKLYETLIWHHLNYLGII